MVSLKYKVIGLIFFVCFLFAFGAYFIWPYHPYNYLKGTEESGFVFTIIGGLTLVVSLIVYMGSRGGYIMKMNSDTEVHTLRESHRKAPFRKAMIILEVGSLLVLYFELVSIIFIANNTYFDINRRVEILAELKNHCLWVIITEIVAFVLYIIYLVYVKQLAYWNIYLANATVFNSEEEMMEALRAETKKVNLKYAVKQFFKILFFNNKEVRAWLLTQDRSEINEEDEYKARMHMLDKIRKENMAKLQEIEKREREKWGD